MGHLGNLGKEERLNASLEYYPHARNVLSVLESLPNAKEIERSTMDDFFTNFTVIIEGSTLNSETLPAMAYEQYEAATRGDFHSIENLASFVYGAARGSVQRFRYHGVRPNVSRPWTDAYDFY